MAQNPLVAQHATEFKAFTQVPRMTAAYILIISEVPPTSHFGATNAVQAYTSTISNSTLNDHKYNHNYGYNDCYTSFSAHPNGHKEYSAFCTLTTATTKEAGAWTLTTATATDDTEAAPNYAKPKTATNNATNSRRKRPPGHCTCRRETEE